MKQRCHNCQYWGDRFTEVPKERWMEECKRYPPTASDEGNVAIWPLTNFWDYCHNWDSLKEEERKLNIRKLLTSKKFCLAGDQSQNIPLLNANLSLVPLGTTLVPLGNRSVDEIKKDVNFVVAGIEQDHKLKEYRDLGIRTIPEKEFIRITSGEMDT